MGLTGRTENATTDARMRDIEAEVRDIRDSLNRQTGPQRWGRGPTPQVERVVVTRTDEALRIDWDAVTMPDLRYYEIQIARRANFGTAVNIRTSNTHHTWTSGHGFTGFYFYVRTRAVSNDRRAGPWSPKIESASADTSTVFPSSGVLKLPKRTNAIVVSGNATTITDITGGWVGRCVTLFFLSTHTVQDSAVLRLAGNFTATVNSSLTLMWFGQTRGWVEVTRTGTL